MYVEEFLVDDGEEHPVEGEDSYPGCDDGESGY